MLRNSLLCKIGSVHLEVTPNDSTQSEKPFLLTCKNYIERSLRLSGTSALISQDLLTAIQTAANQGTSSLIKTIRQLAKPQEEDLKNSLFQIVNKLSNARDHEKQKAQTAANNLQNALHLRREAALFRIEDREIERAKNTFLWFQPSPDEPQPNKNENRLGAVIKAIFG